MYDSWKKNHYTNPARRVFLQQCAAGSSLALALPAGALAAQHKWPPIERGRTIKIGILFSLTGAERVYSLECYKMALMAIDDINRGGGIHGALLEAVVRDPGSDWVSYTRYAKELIDQGVTIIWGCIVSASRKAALPVIQRNGGVLFYGMLYEGRECSDSMIATGSCPNQQTEVGIPWIMKRRGRKVYLVGSNYIFPHTMSKQARTTVRKHGGVVLGDEFVNFGLGAKAPFDAIVADIKQKKPDWILSNLVADNIVGFLNTYKKAGLRPQQMPIMHTGMFESSVAAAGADLCAGHYSLASYFESINTPDNHAFVQRFKTFARSRPEWRNDDATVTTLNEGVYTAALACKAAMLKANSAHPDAILEAARGLEFKSPSGENVKIDADSLHLWLTPRIGQVNRQGEFDIVYQSPTWLQPEVFNPEMDPERTCDGGGRFHIKGVLVPGTRPSGRAGS